MHMALGPAFTELTPSYISFFKDFDSAEPIVIDRTWVGVLGLYLYFQRES